MKESRSSIFFLLLTPYKSDIRHLAQKFSYVCVGVSPSIKSGFYGIKKKYYYNTNETENGVFASRKTRQIKDTKNI